MIKRLSQWLLLSRRGRIVQFAVPISLVAGLTVLLIVSLGRLAEIQQDMRSNEHGNMVWVVSQAQTTVVGLEAALYQFQSGQVDKKPLEDAYTLFASRVNLLLDGPQARLLQSLDDSGQLLGKLVQLNQSQPVLQSVLGGDGQARDQLLEDLQDVSSLLGRTANSAMVTQWEDLGARLDRYRANVLVVILLLLGIFLCSMLISASLFLALRRARETEWVRRQALRLQGELEAERRVSQLHKHFSETISHQFQTPLAIIDSSVQRLRRGYQGSQKAFVDQHTDKIRRATLRLSRLVERTLMAEYYAQSRDVTIMPCAIEPLIQEIARQEADIHPKRQIIIEAPATRIPSVLADAVLLDHVLGNLISNALKYSPDESSVTIKLQFVETEKSVICTITDEGMGLSKEEQAQVFERYYRTQSAASMQGTGLGLFVVHKLVRLMGGKVWVSSAPGAGSEFSVSLPAV